MFSNKFKFAVLNENKEVILGEKDIPGELKTFDVLVKVTACGISIVAEFNKIFSDQFETETGYRTLGADIAGIVHSIGSEVKTVRVGDHVAGVIPLSYKQSGCGEYVIVEEYDLVRVPESISLVDAAACIGDSIRAYIALYYCAKITKDDIILVPNGTMPCAIICIQLAHYVGAKVITTCASPTEKVYLETFDNYIDEIIDLSSCEGVADILYNECMKKTDNLGVDVILDLEPQKNDGNASNFSHTENIISCLTIHGRWVSCNPKLQLDPPDSRKLFERCASISFLYEQAWLMSKIAQGRYQNILQDIMNKLKNNIIRSCTYRTVKFDCLPQMMREILKGNIINKIVVAMK